MKRFFAGTAAALLAAVLILPGEAYAVSAEKAYSLDAVSGRVLFDKNADSRSLIASTTKIMTALVVCERCNVLDRMRIPKEAVGIEGSSMYLREGEVLTIQELLYGLMLSSGNDAAVALAICCGGTVEGFVELMNDKARLLGLRNTHFENPNGLDSPGHYSSARDLAVLAAYAMENPIFAKTVSAKTVTAGQRYLRNHNKLLWMVDGADGVKTGYTKAAGRALVSSATRDGRRIITVTLNDPNDWQEHKALLEEGFSRFHVQRIVTAGDRVGTVEVAGDPGGGGFFLRPGPRGESAGGATGAGICVRSRGGGRRCGICLCTDSGKGFGQISRGIWANRGTGAGGAKEYLGETVWEEGP